MESAVTTASKASYCHSCGFIDEVIIETGVCNMLHIYHKPEILYLPSIDTGLPIKCLYMLVSVSYFGYAPVEYCVLWGKNFGLTFEM